MASMDVRIRRDGVPEPRGTPRPPPSKRNPLLIWGGISGIISALAYGSTQALPFFELFHPFPVGASQPAIVAGFWIPALFPVFALLMAYAVYRFLDEDRTQQRHSAFLGFLFGAIAYPIAVVHLMIQATVHLEGSALANSDPTFSPEMWSSVVAAVHGVDNGIDLAWDLFFVLWLVFTGVAMLGHRRFGLWWGVPAIAVGTLLLVLNAITVPDPPASAGLFDAGPLGGLYALALSVYLVKLGFGDRKGRIATNVEESQGS